MTGGAGFIGSNFVLGWLAHSAEPIVNVDKLTYAGNLSNLESVIADERHRFVRGDIGDGPLIASLLARHQPRAIVHFAAESHVDRSIHGPADFVMTNVVGTFNLLEQCRQYWGGLDAAARERFRFIHISTDEVFGSLGPADPPFSETTAYAPNSPYAASKAASDHLVRAYHHTYGMPVITTNCSNNYGPYQFPEKLIPLMILNAVQRKPLPVYGDGTNVRDWLHVSDHCSALRLVLEKGVPGETYNVGGNSERTNMQVVRALCSLLDSAIPEGAPHEQLLNFVADRPGHDRRYAIDSRKLAAELGWKPRHDFESGLQETVSWYLGNTAWIEQTTSGTYRNWYDTNYAGRIGL